MPLPFVMFISTRTSAGLEMHVAKVCATDKAMLMTQIVVIIPASVKVRLAGTLCYLFASANGNIPRESLSRGT